MIGQVGLRYTVEQCICTVIKMMLAVGCLEKRQGLTTLPLLFWCFLTVGTFDGSSHK